MVSGSGWFEWGQKLDVDNLVGPYFYRRKINRFFKILWKLISISGVFHGAAVSVVFHLPSKHFFYIFNSFYSFFFYHSLCTSTALCLIIKIKLVEPISCCGGKVAGLSNRWLKALNRLLKYIYILQHRGNSGKYIFCIIKQSNKL